LHLKFGSDPHSVLHPVAGLSSEAGRRHLSCHVCKRGQSTPRDDDAVNPPNTSYVTAEAIPAPPYPWSAPVPGEVYSKAAEGPLVMFPTTRSMRSAASCNGGSDEDDTSSCEQVVPRGVK
jgi:hypothetical protein